MPAVAVSRPALVIVRAVDRSEAEATAPPLTLHLGLAEPGRPTGARHAGPPEPPAPRRPRGLRTVGDDELPDGLPAPTEWAERLARVVIEVVTGQRPPAQLAKWTSRLVHADLTRRANCAARHPAVKGQPQQLRRVLSVHACVISPTVVETCAVVSGRTRARAVAIRLEAGSDRWIATAVTLG